MNLLHMKYAVEVAETNSINKAAEVLYVGQSALSRAIFDRTEAHHRVHRLLKEEIRGGKSAKAAIKSGYQKAFSAVLDSNVTTFIAAGVLYALGSGTIKGFAITLGLGVVLTFITAVFLTRLLLNLCCDMYITSTGLYGVKERSVQ